MTSTLTQRPKWQLTCEWLAISAITACFFVTYLSVSLTTVAYLAAFILILVSANWRLRFASISSNLPALSFWALTALFVIGAFYTTSTSALMKHDLCTNIWLLITPFFIMVIKDDNWRQRMINAFLSIMIITVAVSFLKRFFHIDPFASIHFIKIPYQKNDFIFDHIKQSYAMNIAAFICAYRILFENKYKIFYGILFILMAIDIVFVSHGRTGYGVFFVLLVYLSLIRFGWRGTLLTAVLSVLIMSVAFFASPAFHERVKRIVTDTVHYHHMRQLHQTTSVGQRIEMLQISKMMIEKRPWFGYGTGGIRTAMPAVVPLKDRSLLLTPTIDSVESIYLNFWLKFGLFGLIIFLLTVVVQIKASFRLPVTYRHLIQAVLIATLFGGFFCSYFQSFQIKHLYALFFALCFSALNTHENNNCLQSQR